MAFENFPELSPEQRNVLVIHAKTFGNVTQTCKLCGIDRTTFYDWQKRYPQFKEALESEEYEEQQLDFVESKLFENINKNDVASIIFFLKTKGKKRGYVEKTQIEHSKPQDSAPSWFSDEELPKGYLPDQVHVPSANQAGNAISDAEYEMVDKGGDD